MVLNHTNRATAHWCSPAPLAEPTKANIQSGADIRANLAGIDRFAAEAAHDGAALVAFPDYATYEKKKVDATFPAWPSR